VRYTTQNSGKSKMKKPLEGALHDADSEKP
jgi:hypothetical protein